MTFAEENTSASADYRTAAAKNLDLVIRRVIKKWWLILIVGALAGLAGIYTAGKAPILYQSRLSFALDGGESGGVSGAISLASQFGLNLGGSNELFSGDNILEILKTRRMVETTLLSTDTFGHKPYTFIQYFLDQSSNFKNTKTIFPVGQARETFTYQQDSLLFETYNKFTNNYIAADKPDRKYNIYEVRVTNLNEKFTKDFTDRLVAEANSFYTTISSQKAKQTLDLLEQRVALMKGKVGASIGSSAETRDLNLNPAFSAASVPILKEQTNLQAYSGAYTELFKNLEIARFQYLKQIPLLQVIDAADYPMKKIKVSRLKMALLYAVVAGLLTTLLIWITGLFKIKATTSR
jgi:hypothetical protein